MKKYSKPTIAALSLSPAENVALSCPIPDWDPDSQATPDTCDYGSIPGQMPPSIS